MKNLFLILLFACLASGCATSKPIALLPIPEQASQSEREDFYRVHKVSVSNAYELKISEGYYSNQYSLDYLRAYDDSATMRKFPSQAKDETLRWVFPMIVPPVAAVGAGVGGLVYFDVSIIRYLNDTHSPETNPGPYFAVGAVAGALIGTGLTVLWNMSLTRNAHHKAEQVSKVFNGDLLKRLNLEAEPQPGGAKAGIGLSF